LRLEVRPDNEAAINLYRRLGYRQIGTYPRFYADKSDALRYEKLLALAESAVGEDDAEGRSPAPERRRVSSLVSGVIAPATLAVGVLTVKD